MSEWEPDRRAGIRADVDDPDGPACRLNDAEPDENEKVKGDSARDE